MRNMSFFLTTAQTRAKKKFLTTRTGWDFLKDKKYSIEVQPGVFIMNNGGLLVQAVEKCQGLKKGEKVKYLHVIRIEYLIEARVSIECYNKQDVINEGFHEMSVEEFIHTILRDKAGLKYNQPVNKIYFDYKE